jgi:serine/threonine protein phosphatase PrpC
LKYPEFNNPKGMTSDYGYKKRILIIFRYRRSIDNFNGPYISHVPEIKIFELDQNDKYLILSSDGMWDELNKDDV